MRRLRPDRLKDSANVTKENMQDSTLGSFRCDNSCALRMSIRAFPSNALAGVKWVPRRHFLPPGGILPQHTIYQTTMGGTRNRGIGETKSPHTCSENTIGPLPWKLINLSWSIELRNGRAEWALKHWVVSSCDFTDEITEAQIDKQTYAGVS